MFFYVSVVICHKHCIYGFLSQTSEFRASLSRFTSCFCFVTLSPSLRMPCCSHSLLIIIHNPAFMSYLLVQLVDNACYMFTTTVSDADFIFYFYYILSYCCQVPLGKWLTVYLNRIKLAKEIIKPECNLCLSSSSYLLFNAEMPGSREFRRV